jgi:integrase
MAILRNNLRLAGVREADPQGRVFDFHSFRKCTATLLFGAGVGARIVSVYLRHASANLTEHYDDVTQHWDELVRAAATLPKFDPLSRADLFDPDDENWCPFDLPF